jgi:hypothetical protein
MFQLLRLRCNSKPISFIVQRSRMSRMFRFRATWLTLFAGTTILFLLNWQCWRPGVGGAVGGRPPGTELERFFGWPATYQAELWRSDDQALATRILAVAPFYNPDVEMSLEHRGFGVAALTVDVVFALLVLLAVAIIMDCTVRQVWTGGRVMLLAGVGLLLLVLWVVSPSVSISL